MNQVVNLGPLMIQYQWIVDFIGFLAGYITLKVLVKKFGKPEHKNIVDIYSNVILIPLGIWKFGPAIIHLFMVIKQPILILYFSGNTFYLLIGFILSGIYIVYRSKKDKLRLLYIFDYFICAYLTFYLVGNLLSWKYGLPTTFFWGISLENPDFKYHPINIYNLILSLFIIGHFVHKRFKMGKGRYLSDGMIFLGFGKLIISYFDFQNRTFLLLSSNQWLYLGLICGGLCILYKGNIKIDYL